MVIEINSGDNWTTKLTGRGTPDEITVNGGLHEPGDITALVVSGDRFNGADLVDIRGGRELTGMTEVVGHDGVWVKTGETGGPTAGTGNFWAAYADNSPFEDLFLDREVLMQVTWDTDEATTLPGLADREWSWDPVADKIYARIPDPTDREVYLSEVRQFISATVSDVQFNWVNAPTSGDGRQLAALTNMPRISMYASPAQDGAIELSGQTGWVFNGFEISKHHGAGIRLGPGSILENCRIDYNGQIGTSTSSADGMIVRNNTFAWNNTLGYSAGWEAGGTKVAGTDGDEWYGNYVHHNGGPGLWWDIANSNQKVHGNFVAYNLHQGISYEINLGPAEIHHNWVAHGAWLGKYPTQAPPASFVWGAGILVHGSSYVHVHHNVIYFGKDDATARADGMGAVRQNRTGVLAISAISKANPAVVDTTGAHLMLTGDVMGFESVVGMTELMNDPDGDGEKRYFVTVISDTSFSLDGVDSTSFGTYVSSVDYREWPVHDVIFSNNIVQCDREGTYPAGVFDDHSNRIDAAAYADAANIMFINNQYFDNPGSGNHFSHLGGSNQTFATWLADTNVIGDTITAAPYAPNPVLVL